MTMDELRTRVQAKLAIAHTSLAGKVNNDGERIYLNAKADALEWVLKTMDEA